MAGESLEKRHQSAAKPAAPRPDRRRRTESRQFMQSSRPRSFRFGPEKGLEIGETRAMRLRGDRVRYGSHEMNATRYLHFHGRDL